MRLPPGYDELVVGKARAFVWHEAHEWASRTLEEHGSLYSWAAGDADARRLSGRGTVWSVPAAGAGPDGRTRWVVRRYLRGGAMAKILRDTYFQAGPTRPLRELRASAAARTLGVPVPAVVAGAVYPAGPLHYRADLVTEQIPDTRDLAEVLFGHAELEKVARWAPDRAAALRASGRLAVRAGAAGVRHPDLNAKNVLLRPAASHGADPEAWMVDLDRCRIRKAPRPRADTDSMLARLERSLRKFERAEGRHLGDGEWTALRLGAEGPEATHGPGAGAPGDPR